MRSLVTNVFLLPGNPRNQRIRRHWKSLPRSRCGLLHWSGYQLLEETCAGTVAFIIPLRCPPTPLGVAGSEVPGRSWRISSMERTVWNVVALFTQMKSERVIETPTTH